MKLAPHPLYKKTDPFLKSFISVYAHNKNVHNLLLVSLLRDLFANSQGQQNPEFSTTAMDFFVSLEDIINK